MASVNSADKARTITQARLRELLHYDNETGLFTWRITLCNRAINGNVAGYKNGRGYWHIGFDGKVYSAHRLAWLYVYGEFPKNDIDHINGDKTDNRIANLRDVETSINCQNRRKARTGNKSGVLGASWHKRFGKWSAKIRVDGKSIHIGYFDTPEEAGRAYLEAKRASHPGCTI